GQLPTVGSATVGGVVTYAGVRGRMTGSAPGAVFGFVIPGNRGEGIAAAQIPIQFQQVRKGIGVITRLTGIVIGIRLRLGAIAGSKTIAVAAARLTVNGMGVVAARLAIAELGLVQRTEVIAQVAQQLYAERTLLETRTILAVVQVLGVAIVLLMIEGHPTCQIIGYASASRTLGAAGTPVTGSQAYITVVLMARATGNEVDRAGCGVLAPQSALRPTQHLDALEVVDGEGLQGSQAGEDFIAVNTQRALGGQVRLIGTDTANEPAWPGKPDLLAGQARHQALNVVGVVDSPIDDLLATDHGNGHRHTLHILLALLRGHHHGRQGRL